MKNEFNMVDFANELVGQQRGLPSTTSVFGVVITEGGKENYEVFKMRNLEYVQYDYRHIDGRIFSMIGRNLEDCRRFRDEWIAKGGEEPC
jgi:hypothetical protein